jgi:hypothetical protein
MTKITLPPAACEDEAAAFLCELPASSEFDPLYESATFQVNQGLLHSHFAHADSLRGVGSRIGGTAHDSEVLQHPNFIWRWRTAARLPEPPCTVKRSTESGADQKPHQALSAGHWDCVRCPAPESDRRPSDDRPQPRQNADDPVVKLRRDLVEDQAADHSAADCDPEKPSALFEDFGEHTAQLTPARAICEIQSRTLRPTGVGPYTAAL